MSKRKMQQPREIKDPSPFMQLAVDLQALERQAYALNLFKTARAINAAMNEIGWERAERVKQFAESGAVI